MEPNDGSDWIELMSSISGIHLALKFYFFTLRITRKIAEASIANVFQRSQSLGRNSEKMHKKFDPHQSVPIVNR
jgi:hypothetical protein